MLQGDELGDVTGRWVGWWYREMSRVMLQGDESGDVTGRWVGWWYREMSRVMLQGDESGDVTGRWVGWWYREMSRVMLQGDESGDVTDRWVGWCYREMSWVMLQGDESGDVTGRWAVRSGWRRCMRGGAWVSRRRRCLVCGARNSTDSPSPTRCVCGWQRLVYTTSQCPDHIGREKRVKYIVCVKYIVHGSKTDRQNIIMLLHQIVLHWGNIIRKWKGIT